MGDYSSRSKSYGRNGNMMQTIEPYNTSSRPGDFRSYSVSHAYEYNNPNYTTWDDNQVRKKGKMNRSSSYLNDPEFQRKRRVASYKVYSVQGRVKASFRNTFRWLKGKYTIVLYGWHGADH